MWGRPGLGSPVKLLSYRYPTICLEESSMAAGVPSTADRESYLMIILTSTATPLIHLPESTRGSSSRPHLNHRRHEYSRPRPEAPTILCVRFTSQRRRGPDRPTSKSR